MRVVAEGHPRFVRFVLLVDAAYKNCGNLFKPNLLPDCSAISESLLPEHQCPRHFASNIVVSDFESHSNRYLNSKVKYDRGTASTSEIERFNLCKGDVVITKDSETADDIGVSACVTEDMDNLVCGYHLAIVRPHPEKVDGVFLSALFSLHEVRKHFAQQSNGVTRFGLPVKAIASLILRLPPLSVQREIASLLLVADQERAGLDRRLQCITREREALVQRFFGSSDEHVLVPLKVDSR